MTIRVADGEAIGNNRAVQSAFPIVVFGAVGLSIVMSLIFLFTRGSTYDEIGEGGLTSEGGGGPPPLAPDSPAGRAERELEVRQMLRARSERMVSRGQPALDIEAEVARLLGPADQSAYSAGLTEEVRQLVVARNERRVRQGLEPLDVNAEVTRTLQELSPG
jgi:hypothetical protein